MGALQKKQSGHGFTIIEVLVVLSIAGLIMVVVFMAVPALQRNFRNNARKTDARTLVVQRLQYNIDLNTSATIPPGGYECTSPITSKLYCKYLTDLAYYDLDQVIFHSNTGVKPTVVPTVDDPTKILVDSYLECASNNQDVLISEDKRSVVSIYMLEVGRNQWQQACVEGGLAPKS